MEVIKGKVFPFKNNVEEAQAILEEFPDDRPSHLGDNLDPENQQANEDQAEEGPQEDPEFAGMLNV